MQDTQKRDGKPPSIPVFTEENDIFDFYIGKNAGKRLYGKLYDAKKSIKIISPFLTEKMIEELSFKSKENVNEIYLITTVSEHINKTHLTALKLLYRCIRKNEFKIFFNTVFFKGDFLHEKLYIIDDEFVFVGSLNFTNKGVNQNIESVILFKKPDIIQKAISYFNALHSTIAIERWDIVELDKLIQSK